MTVIAVEGELASVDPLLFYMKTVWNSTFIIPKRQHQSHSHDTEESGVDL